MGQRAVYFDAAVRVIQSLRRIDIQSGGDIIFTPGQARSGKGCFGFAGISGTQA